MTREEARGLLMRCEAESYCPHYLQKFNCDGCKQRIALDMAIEALSTDAVSLTGTMKYLTKPHNYCEVVRCKDCRHRDLFSCPLADNDFQKDDDYCSWGERREP